MARRGLAWAGAALILIVGLELCRGLLRGTTLERADLVIGNGAEPQSIDPALARAIPESRVLSCLFEGLVGLHPRTLVPVPAMAESWEIGTRGLHYSFHLRADLRWSDGHPITAQDLRWSYLRVLDPKTGAPYAAQLYAVAGARAYTGSGHSRGPEREAVAIRAPDARTLNFQLSLPTPYFLNLMAFFALYPVPRHVLEAQGQDWVKPRNFVSNGPFRLLLRRLKDRIRVVRNPLYWDVRHVALNSIDLLATESKSTLLNLYMAGQADWICDVPETAIPTIMQRFGPEGSGEYQPRAFLGTYYFRLNTTRVPLNNAKVRRALSLAIDRESIVRNVTRSGELPAHSFTPPGMPGYEPPHVVRHDRKLAARLMAEGLAELGLEAAPTLELLYNTRALHRSIAEVLQHQWSQTLGISVRLRNMEWGAFQTATRTLDYMIARASWYGDYADPNTYAELYVSGGSNNQTGFSDPEYDRMVLDLAPRMTDQKARARILQQAERRLLLQAPIIPLYYDVTHNLVKPDIGGFYQNVQDIHPPKYLERRGSRQ